MPKLNGVSKKFGNNVVLDNFSVDFEYGKINGLIGRSGVGKSTVLNIFCGLTDFEGKIERDYDKISCIFQSDRLLENLTVRQNLDYVLKSVYPNKAERENIENQFLTDCEIFEKQNSFPSELSGGEGKRVAICRAFCYPSELLIMDEPFNSLDEALKNRLITVFLRLYERSMRTCIFVSHSLDEILSVSDNVYLMTHNSIEKFEINIPISERGPLNEEQNKIKKLLLDKLISQN